MKQSCIISIDSQIENDGDTERVEIEANGFIVMKNGSWYVSYAHESIMTRIKLSPGGHASIIRGSQSASRMELIAGETTQCTYKTEYFPISFSVYTDKVQHDLTTCGGTVRLHYTLIYDEETKQKFKLKIKIREVSECPE